MQTSDFDYALPRELIAQEPPAVRGTSRMMVLHRSDGRIEHRHVTDLPDYLTADDLLVLNDTRVFPARVQGQWTETHGGLELLLLEPMPVPEGAADKARETVCWACITGSGRPIRPGQKALFAEGQLEAEILERRDSGSWGVLFRSERPLMELLDRYGLTPVPPYIHRSGDERQARLDRERYQTIYAREVGAVAAPTAGLHFSEALFAALDAKGVRYVSNGKPVKKVAVGGGACGEFVPLALEKGCDAFVTADLSYHEFLDAKALGATVIDAGHFPTEDVVCSVLVRKLKGKYPRLKVKKSASHGEVINYI